MVDHILGFGAACIQAALVVDHVAEFDADSARLLAHVDRFDALSASKRPWWSTT
ncbi:MAG: hypothetical protein ACOX69_05945 [Coriobacteriales bacterium]